MASTSNFSYRRLKNEGGIEEQEPKVVLNRTRTWYKNIKRVNARRRLKVRIPGLRRFLRKKDRVVSSIRLSCKKVIKRFVEGKSHMGDLFAGNYLFMQVSPSPFKCPENSYMIHGLPSGYPLGKVA